MRGVTSLGAFAGVDAATRRIEPHAFLAATPAGSTAPGQDPTRLGWVSAGDHGAVGDGIADDTAAIQASLDAVAGRGGHVVLPPGRYRTTDTLRFRRTNTWLSGRGAMLVYSGNAAAVAADPAVGTQIEQAGLTDLFLDISGRGARGIDFTNFKHSFFQRFFVRLRGEGGVGVYAAGNGLGTGPYYNVIGDFSVEGENDATNFPNQIGVQLVGTEQAEVDSDGPNGNLFSNVGRLAGVAIAVDVQSGQANLFSNLHVELVQDTVFRFNHRSAPDAVGIATNGTRHSMIDRRATFANLVNASVRIVGGTGAGEGAVVRVNSATELTFDRHVDVVLDDTSQYEIYESKASDNRVSQVRVEGRLSATLAQFRAGAANNVLHHVVDVSLSATRWEKDIGDLTNLVSKHGGSLYPLTFCSGDIRANATNWTMLPGSRSAGASGGIPIAAGGAVVGVSMWVYGHERGKVRAVVTNDGREMPMQPVFDEAAQASPNGGHVEAFLEDLVERTPPEIRGAGPINVALVTDAAWVATAPRICVTVWVLL